ncbi:MAG: hypothetical protein RLZZ299_2835, partial [Pseudomonadota bacterium]
NAGTSGGGGPIIDVAAGGQVTVAGQSTSDMLGLTGGAGKLVSTARLGGAIYADASAAPTNPTVALTHVSVFGNSAADDAGAMYLAGVASATLTTSQVHANTSAGGVGGVFVEAGGALTCTGAAGTSTLLGIYDNTGLTDGGVYLERGGPSDASFTANTCDFGTILGGNTNKFGAGPTYTNQDVFAENGGSGTGYHFNANDRTVSCTNGACTPFP